MIFFRAAFCNLFIYNLFRTECGVITITGKE